MALAKIQCQHCLQSFDYYTECHRKVICIGCYKKIRLAETDNDTHSIGNSLIYTFILSYVYNKGTLSLQALINDFSNIDRGLENPIRDVISKMIGRELIFTSNLDDILELSKLGLDIIHE